MAVQLLTPRRGRRLTGARRPQNLAAGLLQECRYFLEMSDQMISILLGRYAPNLYSSKTLVRLLGA